MTEVTASGKKWKKRRSIFQLYQYYRNKIIQGITVDSPPTFIVGCGHSGTSVLLAILGSHSRIYAVPNESYIAIEDNSNKFQKVIKKFDRWTVSEGKNRWVEKTPKHIYHIGKILEWCPDAKILFMIRDGRDVAYSIQARTGSVEEGAKRWVEDNRSGKAYLANPNVHMVKYEDLVGDFESTVRDIVGFLGEDYENDMRDFQNTSQKWHSKKIEKPSTAFGDKHGQYRNWQVTQPLFDGRGRWKNMSDEELLVVHDIAGEMMSEFGYS